MKLNTISKDQFHSFLTKLLLVFIIAQPVFDVLSLLHAKGVIPIGISTYGKPLLAGLMNIALVLVYRKQFWRCALHYSLFLVFMVVHTYLFSSLPSHSIFVMYEVRHILNLLYLLLCWHDIRILYAEAPDREAFTGKLIKALLLCFGLYLLLFLLAVVTGTSGKTYSLATDTAYGFSDLIGPHAADEKLGFKGWFHSGQIFGHALCICLPLLLALLLNNKCKKPWLRILGKLAITVPVFVLCLIGTKVSYYIPVLVLGAQVVLELFFAIREKQRSHIWNAALCAVCLAVCILVYPITPVYQNVGVNDYVLAEEYSDEKLAAFLENERVKHLSEDRVDRPWTEVAIETLEEKFLDRSLHPSLMRERQQIFNSIKFKEAPVLYKLFGIGYLNQQDMTIERDVLGVLFGFGMIAFLLILLRPILIWLQSAYWILRRLFKTDLTTLCLFEGFSMFFFISFYAGYTFLFTQFSIFLTVIMCLLNHRVDKLKALDANGRLPS